MGRKNVLNEIEVNEEHFTHECFGFGTRTKETPIEYKFTCVKMPDGRVGCRCPSCQTTFILRRPLKK
jgi:hypothetical protein